MNNQNNKPPVKKANPDPIKEAIGHPDGPGLEEMLNGEEEKVLKKKRSSDDGKPENGPIPVI